MDIHTHILPGMDDGSKTPEESLAMLREEVRQGIQSVVLTPHFYAQQNSPQQFLQRRQQAWERLEPVLTPELPTLYLGAEVHYFEGICSIEDLNSLCFSGKDLLLLEMPFHPWSSRAVMDVLELSERSDLRVVLAHIERYRDYAPREAWDLFRKNGVQFQCNADFFINWKTRRRAMSMFRSGVIDYVASDCHNMTTRPPNLANARPFLEKCMG